MLNFIARVFRGWMNVLLWLLLIGCAIGGFVAGGILLGGWRFNFGYAFLGLIVGSILGLITVILSGGLIANFLNMVDNIENQNELLSILASQKSLKNKKIDYIVTNSAFLFSEPNTNSSQIQTLSEGNNLTMLEIGGSFNNDNDAYWVKVQTEDDEIGWCISRLLRKI